jgi:hypothetical protein
MAQDTIQWLTPKRARFTKTSPLTKQQNVMELDITQSQWALWNSPNRPLIQQVFPQLTATEREFIQTGYTAEDWAKIFPPEPEE